MKSHSPPAWLQEVEKFGGGGGYGIPLKYRLRVILIKLILVLTNQYTN